ncbi:MAG: hypothetical protein K0Q87_5178, partial [Neobacillus sp.]|nr:hypothetical protein [Neobacillus sp.]
KIETLEAKVSSNKEIHFNDSQKVKELKEELKLLKEDRDLSKRQIESMKYFASLKIKSYPLRELLELDESAQLKDEQIYNAIKYTIFFNGKYIVPPNDLYHVPLMGVIPNRVVTTLPSLHLQVKEGLNEEGNTFAMKALWWVEQFFKKSSFSINDGVLIDPMGLRGPQEKERFILSVKALKLRRQEVENLVNKISTKLSNLDDEISADTKYIQELNSIIHQVKESEAFMTNEHVRIARKKKLEEELRLKSLSEEAIENLKQVQTDLMRLQLQNANTREVLEEEEKVYEELGKMKAKYEERNHLQFQCNQEMEYLKNQKIKLEQLNGDFDELDERINKLEREIRNIDYVLEDAGRKIGIIEKQRTNNREDKETNQINLINIIKELSDLQKLVPTIYSEAANKCKEEPIPSLLLLKNNRENGKVMFDNARREPDIDPAAQDNYNTVKQEYERFDNEYKRLKILLDQILREQKH